MYLEYEIYCNKVSHHNIPNTVGLTTRCNWIKRYNQNQFDESRCYHCMRKKKFLMHKSEITNENKISAKLTTSFILQVYLLVYSILSSLKT